jgi:hypothetical protein
MEIEGKDDLGPIKSWFQFNHKNCGSRSQPDLDELMECHHAAILSFFERYIMLWGPVMVRFELWLDLVMTREGQINCEIQIARLASFRLRVQHSDRKRNILTVFRALGGDETSLAMERSQQ